MLRSVLGIVLCSKIISRAFINNSKELFMKSMDIRFARIAALTKQLAAIQRQIEKRAYKAKAAAMKKVA